MSLSRITAKLVTYLNSATGAVSRTLFNRLSDRVSVMDFGAVGDGVTDDSAAIQAAINSGKEVFFPQPPAFYKITYSMQVPSGTVMRGEHPINTIIRRTNGGGGAVFEHSGSTEQTVIENLRIGGNNCIGMIGGTGGFTYYLSTLLLRNVHFEGDLQWGVRANLIHNHYIDCTFGYYTQTAHNVDHRAIEAQTNGIENVNVNIFENCKFCRGQTIYGTVVMHGGILAAFINCAWEFNTRDLVCSSMSSVLLKNCYTEGCTNYYSAFQFTDARCTVCIEGGHFDGGYLPAAASMFAASNDARITIRDADISVTASAFAYINTNSLSHVPETNVHHRLLDNRIQGNASDPLKWMDGLVDGVKYSFTPVGAGFTVVPGTGGISYAGTYTRVGKVVHFHIVITQTGTCTIANPSLVGNYFTLPSLTTTENGVASMISRSTYVTTSGSVDTGKFYPSTFAATGGIIDIGGSFLLN